VKEINVRNIKSDKGTIDEIVLIDRVFKVMSSCITFDHLQGARKFKELAEKYLAGGFLWKNQRVNFNHSLQYKINQISGNLYDWSNLK